MVDPSICIEAFKAIEERAQWNITWDAKYTVCLIFHLDPLIED